jgi:U4/U6.U5 tri-snRNP-associated protein 2
MSKRQALEPLEDVYDAPSPASKRARVEDVDMESPQPNGASHNGGFPSSRLQNEEKIDILGADAEEHAELREAGALDDDDDDEPAIAAPKRQTAPEAGYTDLYLDTINRKVLDFDFEKLCSVTLSNINVYACLVCGKYYQGRGPKSQAYFHALEEGHHVYVNMETKKVFVLPEGYEVKSKSLDDIKFVVDPRMSKAEVARLDKDPKVSRLLQRSDTITVPRCPTTKLLYARGPVDEASTRAALQHISSKNMEPASLQDPCIAT